MFFVSLQTVLLKMSEKRPLILITNDDSCHAKGLKKLTSLMRTLGDVVVITTEQVMSSKSHSATLQSPLYVRLAEESDGFKEYHCNGTPVDCVKLGYQRVLERWPDLVVSGINHGSNAGSTVVYSATVGAVVEACMDGMTAIGFSLDCFDADADFDHLDEAILSITRKVLAEGLPKAVCLNVNFPKRCDEPLKGIKICRQATGKWVEPFEAHHDENGNIYYDLKGEFVSDDIKPDTDLYAIAHNYVSMVPTQYDWTAKSALDSLRNYESMLLENGNQG